MPPRILRSGTFVLFVVFLSLLISSYFFPYSETIIVPVRIEECQITTIPLSKNYIAIAYVPIDVQSKIAVGQKSVIEIEGYNRNTYGQIASEVHSRTNKPITKEKKKYILFQLSLHNGLVTNNGTPISYYDNMQGAATITLKKERLLTVLFSTLRK